MTVTNNVNALGARRGSGGVEVVRLHNGVRFDGISIGGWRSAAFKRGWTPDRDTLQDHTLPVVWDSVTGDIIAEGALASQMIAESLARHDESATKSVDALAAHLLNNENVRVIRIHDGSWMATLSIGGWRNFVEHEGWVPDAHHLLGYVLPIVWDRATGVVLASGVEASKMIGVALAERSKPAPESPAPKASHPSLDVFVRMTLLAQHPQHRLTLTMADTADRGVVWQTGGADPTPYTADALAAACEELATYLRGRRAEEQRRIDSTKRALASLGEAAKSFALDTLATLSLAADDHFGPVFSTNDNGATMWALRTPEPVEFTRDSLADELARAARRCTEKRDESTRLVERIDAVLREYEGG